MKFLVFMLLLVFPARAGMIPPSAGLPASSPCIPRESGDDPELDKALSMGDLYSPRERG